MNVAHALAKVVPVAKETMMKITKKQLREALSEAMGIKDGTGKISKRRLRMIIREEKARVLAEMQHMEPGMEQPAPAAPKTKKKRWKAEVTDEYDKGYKDGMADVPPPEDASRSYDDGYTDALADIAEKEEMAAAAAAPPMA